MATPTTAQDEGVDNTGNADDDDIQELLKIEFSKLHKDFRMLENKRHGIAQNSASSMKKTSRLLPLLKQEEVELSYELSNATCQLHRHKAQSLAASMKDALKTYDHYQFEIKRRLKQIKEIESHVDRISAKVLKQRIKMLAALGFSKTLPERNRDLQKAEDKLYHVIFMP